MATYSGPSLNNITINKDNERNAERRDWKKNSFRKMWPARSPDLNFSPFGCYAAEQKLTDFISVAYRLLVLTAG